VRLLAIVLTVFLVPAVLASAEEEAPTAAGDVLIAGADYEGAVQHYREALEAGANTPGLHYNLGLSYAHTGEFGLANFHVIQAHFLAPRDSVYQEAMALMRVYAERVRAESTSGEVVTGQPSAISWLDFFNRFSRGESELVILIAIWLAFGLLLFRRRMKPSGWRDAFFVASLASFALLAGATTYRIGTALTQSATNAGVVVGEEARVREGPDRSATTLADTNLALGSIVVIKEMRDDWVNIELSDGRVGWALEADVRAVQIPD